MLAVLTDTTVTGGDVSAVLPCLAKVGGHTGWLVVSLLRICAKFDFAIFDGDAKVRALRELGICT